MSLARDDGSHTAPRVCNITAAARDQVDMTVKDRLAGDCANIHADVETLDGSIAVKQIVTKKFQQFVGRRRLLAGHFEVGWNMPPGEHKGMERRHWVSIPDGKYEVVSSNDARTVDVTEWAMRWTRWMRFGHLNSLCLKAQPFSRSCCAAGVISHSRLKGDSIPEPSVVFRVNSVNGLFSYSGSASGVKTVHVDESKEPP
jgi:hypothetical protein